VAGLSGWRKRPVVRHSRVVRLSAAAWPHLLVDATLVARALATDPFLTDDGQASPGFGDLSKPPQDCPPAGGFLFSGLPRREGFKGSKAHHFVHFG